MGKSSSSKTQVTNYYLSMIYGLCSGPVDAIHRVISKEKNVFEGRVEDSSFVMRILRPELFQGIKNEGGLYGDMHFRNGAFDQELPSHYVYKRGEPAAELTAFRGIATLTFLDMPPSGVYQAAWSAEEENYVVTSTGVPTASSGGSRVTHGRVGASDGFYWGSNNPYTPAVEATVERTPKGWNEAEAAIPGVDAETLTNYNDANPAHIIYECLTNRIWGMGTTDQHIDLDSFAAASTTLIAENFGLSMVWMEQATIETFVQEVLSHISGVLFVNARTGKLTLKLLRGDYDVNQSVYLDADNCKLDKFSRRSIAEITNEVTITWTNPENEEEESVTIQDLGAIVSAGGEVISDTRNYYGIRNQALAWAVAQREIATVAAPLASAEVKAQRGASTILPGDVVVLNFPEYGAEDLPMRVNSVSAGKPGSSYVALSLIEDVYSTESPELEPPDTGTPISNVVQPVPITSVAMMTAPHYFSGFALGYDVAEDSTYPEAIVMPFLQTGFEQAVEAEVFVEEDDGQYLESTTIDFINRGQCSPAMVAEEETSGVNFGNGGVGDGPLVGGFALILNGDDLDDAEMVELTTYDDVNDQWTIKRGVLDTVPVAHAAQSSVIYFSKADRLYDKETRNAGDDIDYKACMATNYRVASTDEVAEYGFIVTERPHLPYRPANVQVEGTGFGEVALAGDIDVTWSNRNRITEEASILSWGDASVAPETGQTTTIELRSTDGTIYHTIDGLSGESATVSASLLQYAKTEIVVSAKRDGLQSLQNHYVTVNAPSGYGEFWGEAYGGQ